MKQNPILERVRPLTEQIATKLSETLLARLDRDIALVGEAFSTALASMGALPTSAAPSAKPVVEAKPAKKRKAKQTAKVSTKPAKTTKLVAAGTTSAGKPRQRAVMKCRKCGELGFRSDGCGRTHNIKPDDVPSSDSDDEEPAAAEVILHAPKRRRLQARDLAEELPVIPHSVLVRMLAADREVAGDAGGYVVRADRQPTLIGSTDEKREVCPIHGWVGRVAFDRDQHDMCSMVLDGTECRTCEGRKVVAGGWCRRCSGSGIEPEQVEEVADDTPAEPRRIFAVEGYELMRDRESSHNTYRNAPRSHTIARKNLTRDVLAAGRLEVEAAGPPVDEERPRTRESCREQERPCPYVGCRHHLFLDVDPETGSIKFNFPDVEPDEMIETCSLDVAEREPLVLHDVANLMNLTRERARQLEVKALHKLKSTRIVRGARNGG